MKLFSSACVASLALLSGCRDKTPVAGKPVPVTNAVVESTPYLPHAQPRLQTMSLYVGGETLVAELALKPVEVFTGMMWRTNMAEGEAMLFGFGQPHRAGFYMRNTFVPLSIAYVDSEGVIQEIHDLHPQNENPVEASVDTIQYAIEVPQGWFKRHNISTGALVRTPMGELKRTFTFTPR